MRIATRADLTVCAVLLLGVSAATAHGAEWRPEKRIEIVIPSGAGGGNDRIVRLIQKTMQDAKLKVSPEHATRTGVFIASGIGGFSTIEREHRALLEGGPRRISPFFIPAAIINLAAGQV